MRQEFKCCPVCYSENVTGGGPINLRRINCVCTSVECEDCGFMINVPVGGKDGLEYPEATKLLKRFWNGIRRAEVKH